MRVSCPSNKNIPNMSQRIPFFCPSSSQVRMFRPYGPTQPPIQLLMLFRLPSALQSFYQLHVHHHTHYCNSGVLFA
jgi:hypothetical protein